MLVDVGYSPTFRNIVFPPCCFVLQGSLTTSLPVFHAEVFSFAVQVHHTPACGHADREIFIFPVQLTTCKIGNLLPG